MPSRDVVCWPLLLEIGIRSEHEQINRSINPVPNDVIRWHRTHCLSRTQFFLQWGRLSPRRMILLLFRPKHFSRNPLIIHLFLFPCSCSGCWFGRKTIQGKLAFPWQPGVEVSFVLLWKWMLTYVKESCALVCDLTLAVFVMIAAVVLVLFFLFISWQP